MHCCESRVLRVSRFVVLADKSLQFTYVGPAGTNGVGVGNCYLKNAASDSFTGNSNTFVAAIRYADYAGPAPTNTVIYTAPITASIYTITYTTVSYQTATQTSYATATLTQTGTATTTYISSYQTTVVSTQYSTQTQTYTTSYVATTTQFSTVPGKLRSLPNSLCRSPSSPDARYAPVVHHELVIASGRNRGCIHNFG